jgi:ADP-heptose:LPS heptosyltransferase
LKFLVIRFSSIGDIILTTPVVRCLKKRYPDAEIHYLTKAQFHPLLAANPYITRFHLLEDDLDVVIDDLRKEKFDVVIDLHKNIRSFRIRKALGVKSYTYNKLNIQKWLRVNFKIENLPDKHLVDRYFDALTTLEVENDGLGLDYYILEKEIRDFVPALTQAPYIAFAVGAKHNTKKLPDEKVIELCEKITGRIMVIGGKTEIALGDKLNQLFPAKVANMCGRLNLNESAFIVKHARKVIAHDTGFMHIAAAFKKPVISIWGNTIPAFGMYPYYGKRNELRFKNQSFIFEVEGLPCRPCSKLGYESCPRHHFKCMNGHDLDAIAAAANAL